MGKIKKVENIKGHMTKEQLSQHKDAEKALKRYPKLNFEPPQGMKREAVEEWNRIVPLLAENTPVSELDRALIEVYCNAFAQYKLCEQEVNHDGVVVTSTTGTKVRNPYIMEEHEAIKTIKMTATELGLSVNARAKLELNRAKSDKPSDPFEKVLSSE
ncbi:phage terminase small subunit P27 family [Pediococcus parvulus]|uniref:phage terminase small subunit P27 family n=1 Tax=Pediococcus parvulus TaxID=54062 RepID=UPI0021A7C21B|nr:phage terminase small subunit P27 family [Pediococcus parvulus]MCT3031212.1 phage terminase small subunit P27 family [Pediococcus parvulus]